MARGAVTPSITPVWKREIFSARNPPLVACTHPEFDQVEDIIPSSADMVNRSFSFTNSEVSALRKFLPKYQRKCSMFEVLSAYMWRCRTLSLQLDSEEEVRFMCIVNARARKFNTSIPIRYYGNTIACPVVVTTAGKLCESPLGYALELVREAKAKVTEEYMQSLADLMVIKGRPPFTRARTYIASDTMHVRFADIDYGWGKAGFGGIVGTGPGRASYYVPFVNEKGESGYMVPTCLPSYVMERFEKNLKMVEVGAQNSKL